MTRNPMLTWLLAIMATAATANASSSISGELSPKAMSNMIRKGRFLEQGGGDEADDATVETLLVNYSVKLVGCNAEQVVPDYENGGSQIGAAIFRLCPNNSCDDTSQDGCSEGYAELAIGLYTFVEEFMADKEDNMQWDDDNFNGEDFAQCSQYEPENDDDSKSYYIGPTCTEDGTGVRFALFKDYGCYNEYEDVTFEDVSGGWSLPYENGGLVSTYCNPCTDDDGLKEMCIDLYDEASYRCETGWEVSHYYWDAVTEIYRYGQDELGCKTVQKLRYGEQVKGPDWADIIGLTLLVLVTIAGVIGYLIWWKEKKTSLELIDPEEDDDHHYDEHDDDDHERHDDVHYDHDDDADGEGGGNYTLA